MFTVDAGSIAVSWGLGSASNPIVNTAILGAFCRATGLVASSWWNRPLKPMFRRRSTPTAGDTLGVRIDPYCIPGRIPRPHKEHR